MRANLHLHQTLRDKISNLTLCYKIFFCVCKITFWRWESFKVCAFIYLNKFRCYWTNDLFTEGDPFVPSFSFSWVVLAFRKRGDWRWKVTERGESDSHTRSVSLVTFMFLCVSRWVASQANGSFGAYPGGGQGDDGQPFTVQLYDLLFQWCGVVTAGWTVCQQKSTTVRQNNVILKQTNEHTSNMFWPIQL